MAKNLDFQDFKGLNIFIGSNATGKSTVLYALSALLESGGLALSFESPFRGSLDTPVRLETEVTFSDNDVKCALEDVVIRQNAAEIPPDISQVYVRAATTDFTIWIRGAAPRNKNQGVVSLSKHFEASGKNVVDFIRGKLHDERTRDWDASELNVSATFERSLQSIITERTMYLPTSRHPQTTFIPGILTKPNPQSIGQWFHASMIEKRRDLKDYEDTLSAFLPHVKGTAFSIEGNALRWGLEEKGLRGMTPVNDWSSGTIHLGLLAASLSSMPAGSTIIAEEPELSLHPGAIRGLMGKIREQVETQKIQFFLSTHSPHVVEEIRPSEKSHSLWQFDRSPDGSASVHRCETEKEIEDAINSLH